jgi:hypothetical protein
MKRKSKEAAKKSYRDPSFPEPGSRTRAESDYLTAMARDLYDDDPEEMEKKRKQYDAREKFHRIRGDYPDKPKKRK